MPHSHCGNASGCDIWLAEMFEPRLTTSTVSRLQHNSLAPRIGARVVVVAPSMQTCHRRRFGCAVACLPLVLCQRVALSRSRAGVRQLTAGCSCCSSASPSRLLRFLSSDTTAMYALCCCTGLKHRLSCRSCGTDLQPATTNATLCGAERMHNII